MEIKEIQVMLYPQIIVRTPVFHLEDSIKDKLEDLKNYINYASPDFYRVIEHLNADSLLNLDNKTSLSFYKYFNRARLRSVPFGLFATLSMFEVGKSHDMTTIGDPMNITQLLDWDYNENFLDVDPQMLAIKYLKANTTIYAVNNCFRYVAVENGVFQIMEINSFPELSFILELCKEKIEKEELCTKIKLNFNLTKRSIDLLLKDLNDRQLLFHNLNANLVGEDYFTRCNFQISDNFAKSYIISERNQVSGGYWDNSLENISELANHLNLNLPYVEPPHLEQFKKEFLRKFDRQSIPLSIALDPELGIGYASLESISTDSPNYELEQIFKSRKNGPMSNKYNSYLLYALSQTPNRIVQMEEFDGEVENESPFLPNTFSVIYHSYGSIAVIDSLGGTSANNLLGRFTICNPKIHELALKIAEIEQKANPFVAFFDVSFRSEKHVDNINRRQKIYKYELPLLTWSESESGEILNTSDIEVSVIDNEIILFSKKLGKRVLPRIPTAYNYHRSGLSVYRFLSDIQHQGIRSDLTLSLKDYFPNLKHYPRVCYKQFVLSPECWKLPDNFVNKRKDKSFATYELEMSNWLKTLQIDKFFKTGHGDQTLTFDLNNERDLRTFSLYCFHSNERQIYISEALIDINAKIKGSDGRNFSSQVQLNMYHEKQIFDPRRYFEMNDKNLTRQLLPGGEWLYVEIYCHHMRANRILTSEILDFIKNNKKYLKKWFYIRYSKNGNHIRLRLHLKNPENSLYVFNDLKNSIYNHWQTGFISELQLKTYQREVERYNIDYERVEFYFYLDSKLVINVLKKKHSNEILYRFALNSMKLLLREAFADLKEQLNFVSALSARFVNEFSFDSSAFKLINHEYEKFQTTRDSKSSPISISKNQLVLFKQIIKKYTEAGQKYEILGDLIHMHINRIFAENARRHEAILYQYLLKDTKTSMNWLAMIQE